MDSRRYKLNDYVSFDEFNNLDLKKKLEKEGLEIYFNKPNSYTIRINLEKIKQMLLDGENIESIDYERYKKEIDDFLQQNNKKIDSSLADPMHNTIDFYFAVNIENVYGKTEIYLVEYNLLTTDQQEQYERNPFNDTYLYKNSEYYKTYTKLKLYKLINKGMSESANKLLDEDTNVLKTLNAKFSIDYETGNTLLYIAVLKGLTSVVKKMLEKGANPNVQNNEGNTPLHVAVQQGMTTTVKNLLEKGANPNVQNNEGNTPLQIAVQQGMTTTVENLLEKGANPNVQNNEGNTPLHIAAQNDFTKAIEILVEKGADKRILNNEEDRPLNYAKDETNKKMLRLGGSIKKKGRVNILNVNNNVMAKSRRKNRKSLKRRNSRKNFRKM